MRCGAMCWLCCSAQTQCDHGPDRGAARGWAWCRLAAGCATGPLESGGKRVGAWPHVVDGGELAGVLVRLAQTDAVQPNLLRSGGQVAVGGEIAGDRRADQ